MEKNKEIHTYKPSQERSFRVVLKNIHRSTDLNDIKESIKEYGAFQSGSPVHVGYCRVVDSDNYSISTYREDV
jgi:hypothetical protein